MHVVRVKFSECYVVVMLLVRYVTQERRYLAVVVVRVHVPVVVKRSYVLKMLNDIVAFVSCK